MRNNVHETENGTVFVCPNRHLVFQSTGQFPKHHGMEITLKISSLQKISYHSPPLKKKAAVIRQAIKPRPQPRKGRGKNCKRREI